MGKKNVVNKKDERPLRTIHAIITGQPDEGTRSPYLVYSLSSSASPGTMPGASQTENLYQDNMMRPASAESPQKRREGSPSSLSSSAYSLPSSPSPDTIPAAPQAESPCQDNVMRSASAEPQQKLKDRTSLSRFFHFFSSGLGCCSTGSAPVADIRINL